MSTNEIVAYNYGRRMAAQHPAIAATFWQYGRVGYGADDPDVKHALRQLGEVKFRKFFLQGVASGEPWPG